MKILSKFRDYYDKGSLHGIDPDIVYIRNREQHSVLAFRDIRRSEIMGGLWHGGADGLSILCFCGELPKAKL